MTEETDVDVHTTVPASLPSAPAPIRVWDLPTRAFHWTLVALVATLWVSGSRGWMTVHYVCGVAVLVLVSFRVVWGFWGSSTARFADFIARPGRVLAYLRELGRGDDSLHAGHNPAGGWMVLTFLTLILAQAVLGLFANDEFDFKGPLAEWISGKRSDLLTRVHVFLFDAILVCTWVHVCAITYYALVKRDNLTASMLHGCKLPARVPVDWRLGAASNARAFWILVAVTVVILSAVFFLRGILE